MSEKRRFHALRRKFEANLGFDIFDWRKGIIWAIGFGLMLAFAVKDFLAIRKDYHNGNVATNVDVVVMDENFKPPQIVIWIPIYKIENRNTDLLMDVARHLHKGTLERCGTCKSLAKKSWDVWTHRDITSFCSYDVDTCYYALSIAFSHKIFTTMETEGNDFFHPASIFWEEIIFSAATNFIILLSSADYYFAGSPFLRKVGDFHTRVIPQNKTTLEIMLNQVLLGLCRDITYSHYRYKNEFAESVYINSSCPDLLTNVSTFTCLDRDGLYIALPASKDPVTEEHRFAITDHWKNPYWKATSEREPAKLFRIYPDTGIIYAASVDTVYSTYVHQSSMIGGHKITLRYSTKLRAEDATLACENGSSATICFTMCTKYYIIDNCKCVPFSTRQGLLYNQTLPYCTLQHYTACNITDSIPLTAHENCKNKCRYVCQYLSYSWFTDDYDFKVQKANTVELQLFLTPVFATFPQFIWTNKTTHEQFLSQVGGIVNFYLGFSGLSLIPLAFLIIDFISQLWTIRSLERQASGSAEQSTYQRSARTVAMAERPAAPDWRSQIRDEVEAKWREEFEGFRKEMKADLAAINDAMETLCQRLDR